MVRFCVTDAKLAGANVAVLPPASKNLIDCLLFLFQGHHNQLANIRGSRWSDYSDHCSDSTVHRGNRTHLDLAIELCPLDPINNAEGAKQIRAPRGEIVFDNVSFKYKDADDCVLENISFTALPGQTTAFIGSTGSGKSTLINLIPRFYDVTQGTIRFDGTDIRKIDLHSLRENIGYVPQKGVLFKGTVESNLKIGNNNADTDTLSAALTTAQARFVADMPDGINSEIAQGGTNVSGGQRQRLAIARALAKKSPVYIFDDSFSALDLKTDAALRKALKGYTKDATVLIVAQRVSTIMNAEQIIVLDEGRIVGKGTHKELLKTCTQYREIAESQLAKEELE